MKTICITQNELIQRKFWVNVPEDMSDDDIEEKFFEENIGGLDHHGERYKVSLDIDLCPDEKPDDVEPYDLEE